MLRTLSGLLEVRTFFVLAVVAALFNAGCGDPIREDRTIEFSQGGGQVAFQHGEEGVYVADAAGAPVRIFQPDGQVVATSPPLPSPVDDRWIFTTASPQDPHTAEALQIDLTAPPDGRVVQRLPVLATCWLREAAQEDGAPTVRKLFTVECDHAGYVAAGLLVRWHPSGQGILYVGEEPRSGRRTLFEYELASGAVRRVFPHAGETLCFDWSPRGSRVACVVGNLSELDGGADPADGTGGVWIGTPGQDESWTRLPRTQPLSIGEFGGPLDRVRASRPSWTANESTIACLTTVVDRTSKKPRHEILLIDVASREVTSVVPCQGSCFDLHWSPDGRELGFVERSEDGVASVLRFVARDVSAPRTYDESLVRRFAGWDNSGEQFAIVVPTAAPSSRSTRSATDWALLAPADPLARDAVRVVGREPEQPSREVFSGMRVTFPQWSPTESRLSLWLTFSPPRRSLASLLARLGLTPGDPAATIDLATGDIGWMAVSPQEELQIGHYHLLKHREAEALRWYELARRRLPAPVAPSNWDEFVRRLQVADPGLLFESICLRRLGRAEESATREAEFESTFFPDSTAGRVARKQGAGQDRFAVGATLDALFAADPESGALVRALLHDLYVAEVFLSLDAVDEGLEYFRRESPATAQRSAETKPGEAESIALSRAIVIGQLLLIADRHGDYVTHCSDELGPRLAQRWQTSTQAPGTLGRTLLELTGALALAPLARPDFYRGLPAEDVRRARKAWAELRRTHSSGRPATAIDVVLRASAIATDDPVEAQAAVERLRAEFRSDMELDEAISRLFELSSVWTNRR